MQHPAGGRGPDHSSALAQYRRRASGYDRELALFEPVRRKAIECLTLRAGDTVLDLGCGTGLSFGPLLSRIGETGSIVSIELSPEMLARARQRVEASHWANVSLVCAPVEAARIAVMADAALFHFTHDIVRDPKAIAHVLRHLRPGARVVATGLQWAPPWLWPTNGFVLLAALYSVSSLEGLARPWDRLMGHLRDVQVDSTMIGGVYIASGIYQPHA